MVFEESKLYEISTIFLSRKYVEPTVNFANFFQEVKSGTFSTTYFGTVFSILHSMYVAISDKTEQQLIL